MSAQFQYTRLAYQAQAVDSVFQVFTDVRFVPPGSVHANPTYVAHEAQRTLQANIERIRQANGIQTGAIDVPHTPTPALSLDVLMETGTGKTFTFIETIHRLRQNYGLSKFIVLVPSNAIRQGTIKTLQTTAAFFAREYGNQKINVFNYSDKTVKGFIHAANAGISVMVATYQSFAGDNKVINKRGVESNLFGRAKSYMEALAAIRPVLIIDEPHRFDGKVVKEYLPKFNPILTLRFGATFKRDEFKNLIYTLDSLEAFRQRLVKGITVDTVGSGADMAQTLLLNQVSGSAKARTAQVRYQTATGKTASITLQAKDNLGEKTGLAWLEGYVVEGITTKELLFTNGFTLPLGEATGYGMLADEVQSLLVQRTVANHFEREEALFKRGIKAISLFFIDAVYKYLPDGQRPAVLRETFERHYLAQLTELLARPDLDPDYRAYLARTTADVSRVHKGYFARSHSEKGEEEAIKLILQDKERLLSFDTDLRFIFSMWALQEGWDNPNVFTLCKLAPSDSKITKLQQIGRGLRLAVNQQLERVSVDDAAFDEINDLVVVVPASEGDFVRAIQSEIAAHSVKRVSQQLSHEVLRLNGIIASDNPFMTVALLGALAQQGIAQLDMASGTATLVLDKAPYQARRDALERALLAQVPGFTAGQAKQLVEYLDAYYDGAGQIKAKKPQAAPQLTIRPEQYQKFKHLWENLNRRAVLRYDLDTEAFKTHVLQRIASDFKVLPLSVSVTRTTGVETINEARSVQSPYLVKPHSVYTLAQFVRELANMTRLSVHTVADILRRMPEDKFAQIQHNENRALLLLRDVMQRCIHELVINKVSYALREIRVETALTDRTGQLLKTIPLSLCGKEEHAIGDSSVRDRSLYQDALMPVDSQIERDTVDASNHTQITVFAKLPRINIPTPAGNYNPDFGYVLTRGGQAQSLYLVVETKGYDSTLDIPQDERWKIDAARQFFAALQAEGVNVRFSTRINTENLGQIIQQIDAQV
ncbi:DEAD/DEAH box helicase family protein [Kinneretia asaccharophila]|uniref:Type III restriction enzyme n=1 Tax=Roseateles asaccharophilus TaxID=582607 RepID=A0A4R6MZ23_9BURK|nr:DEAD/DEAH box helicase family protein [Roseateles asaccharophilus]MDN3545517.1 DEAD/DEAH box helicase family protein [Roseateles asaccharophilus]TDP07897.1 type III restriction enzyme [Roseateles asaccharophilus]